MSSIFEQPWPLLITAGVVLLLVIIFHGIFPQKRRWWHWLLPLLLVVAAFGLDFLVETDHEKISSVIETGAKAVEKENPAAIDAIIADDYSDSCHGSKTGLMRHCRITLAEPLVEKNITRIQSIKVSLPNATAIFTVRMIFDKRGYAADFKEQLLVKAEAKLRKQPDGRWLITRVEILELDLRPASWKDFSHAKWG